VSDPHRKVREIAQAEASRSGASVSFEEGKKHIVMTLTLGGETRKLGLSRSTKIRRRDHREDWIKQDIRRLLKEIQCSISKRSQP
jgi:hypothetical protein